MFFICPELSIVLTECSNNEKCSLGTTKSLFPTLVVGVEGVCRGGGGTDLWSFRNLDFSRVVLSRPMIGPFATRYFSHLFDPSRFATSVIFAVCCQLTVNYSLTTSCIQSFLLISISQFYFRTIKVVL